MRILLACVFALVLAAPASAQLTSGLVAYYALDEASGGALDAHAGHTATETSGTIAAATGTVSGARDFELADDEFFDSASADFNAGNIDFSFSAWVRLESNATGAIVAKYASTGNQRAYVLDYDATSSRFRFYVSSDGASGGSVGLVPANVIGAPSTATWYFIVAWHDSVADTLNIQVNDGTADSIAWTTGVFASSTAAFHIGAQGTTASPLTYWDGLIDEVGFWKRALSSTERTFLYNAGAGRSYADIVTQSAGFASSRGTLVGVLP